MTPKERRNAELHAWGMLDRAFKYLQESYVPSGVAALVSYNGALDILRACQILVGATITKELSQ